MYDYNRQITKSAASVSLRATEPYEDALTILQEEFVGLVAQKVAEYINTTSRRLRKDGSWTWGTPRGRGVGTYSIVVYNEMKMTATPPTAITIYFKFNKAIEVYAVTSDTKDTLLNKKVDFGKSASGVALSIGAGWEKLTTGDVDYGS